MHLPLYVSYIHQTFENQLSVFSQYRNQAQGSTLQLKLHLDTKLELENETKLLHGVSIPYIPKSDRSISRHSG